MHFKYSCEISKFLNTVTHRNKKFWLGLLGLRYIWTRVKLRYWSSSQTQVGTLVLGYKSSKEKQLAPNLKSCEQNKKKWTPNIASEHQLSSTLSLLKATSLWVIWNVQAKKKGTIPNTTIEDFSKSYLFTDRFDSCEQKQKINITAWACARAQLQAEIRIWV